MDRQSDAKKGAMRPPFITNFMLDVPEASVPLGPGGEKKKKKKQSRHRDRPNRVPLQTREVGGLAKLGGLSHFPRSLGLAL